MYQQFWADRIQNTRITGNQINSDCPFCKKEKHFYASIDTGQFNCKLCGKSGNAITFLRDYEHKKSNEVTERLTSYGINEDNRASPKISDHAFYKRFDERLVEQYVANLPEGTLKNFAEERGLPVEILKKYKIGMNDHDEFTLPIYDAQGVIRDIRRKRIGGDTISSAGAELFLFGIQDLLSSDRIFVTEGAWSKMALEVRGYPSVGVPGAFVFKDEWISYFKDKAVHIVYDLDNAGEDGARKVIEKLNCVAKEIRIIKLPKELGEGKDIRDFFKSGRTKKQFEELIGQAEIAKCEASLPLSLPEFMKQDIPPLEYHISDVLPRRGKGMISAQANMGKTILAQNFALSMVCGKTKILDKFDILSARVLYLDLEMGESALKERFQKMQTQVNLAADKLFIKSLPSLDLLSDQHKQLLEGWLERLKVDVLILDPLGHAWVGNENDQEQVSRLTAYLNELIAKFEISVLILHHWRKNTKGYNSGGQMAAGSYRWEAWLDCHITLEGIISSVTVSSQKNRHRPKFAPFIAKLNEETLWFEYLGDYEQKFDESDLTELFDSFGSDRVAVPDLIERAKTQKICSEATIRKLIKATAQFDVDKSGKTHYLARKAPKS